MERISGYARLCFVIGSFGFVAIGALHVLTHYLELAGGPLRDRFMELGLIAVSGQQVESWDLFQGTSVLMGVFSIAIGLGGLGALRAAGRGAQPPAATAGTNIAALICVIAVGAVHLGALQIWGGLFGIAMFAPSLVPRRAAQRSGGASTVG